MPKAIAKHEIQRADPNNKGKIETIKPGTEFTCTAEEKEELGSAIYPNRKAAEAARRALEGLQPRTPIEADDEDDFDDADEPAAKTSGRRGRPAGTAKDTSTDATDEQLTAMDKSALVAYAGTKSIEIDPNSDAGVILDKIKNSRRKPLL